MSEEMPQTPARLSPNSNQVEINDLFSTHSPMSFRQQMGATDQLVQGIYQSQRQDRGRTVEETTFSVFNAANCALNTLRSSVKTFSYLESFQQLVVSKGSTL
jgi:hypothetical protein